MDFHKKTENNKMSLCILEILGDNNLSKLGTLERTSAYKGVFFVENEHSIVFVHCMVKDVICKLLVLKHPCLFLKYSSSNFIRERVRLSKFLHSKDIPKAHLIILSEELITSYLKRMLKEIVRGSAEKVFCHSQAKSPSFQDEVIEHLTRLSNEKIEKIVFSYCKQESTEHSFIFVEKSRNDNETVPIVLPTAMNEFQTCTIDFIVVAGLNGLLLFVESKFKKRVREHILKNTNVYRELAIISGNVETYKLITEIDTRNTTTSRHVVQDLGKAVFLGKHSTIQFLLHHSPICKESMKYAGICGYLAEISLRLRKPYPNYMRLYFKFKRMFNRHIGVGNSNDRREQQQVLYENKLLEIQSISGAIQRNIAISKFQFDYLQSIEEDLEKNGETKVPTLLNELLKINEEGISFLEVASVKGYDNVVRSVLDNMLSYISTDIEDNLEKTLYNALRKATFFGNADVLQTLLEYGAVVHLVSDMKDTPLMIAASKGYMLISEILIQHHAHINHTNLDGYTAVHFAARKGHCDIIDLLCRNGAIINVVCEEGQTPLFVAARNGHLKALNYLLTVESVVDFPDNTETTPLLTALTNGHSECVELLLRFGADPRFIFPDCYKCCSSKSFNLCHSCIIESVLNYIQLRHMGPTSSMFGRERNPNLDMFRKMVNSIVQTHDKHLHESVCLILAAKNGRTDVIQHMLQEGCNIDQQNEEGYTAIYAAASRGQTKTVEFLIKHSANLNIASTSGMTPLLSSLENGNFDAAQLLIQNKADVNASAFGENALLLSIQWRHTDLAKKIRINGGRMNIHSMLLAIGSGEFNTLFTKIEKIGLIFSMCSLVVFRFYFTGIFQVCIMLFFICVIYVILKYEYICRVAKQRDQRL
jgi:ankyrin repeat protein